MEQHLFPLRVTYTAGSTNVVLSPSSALVADRLYTVTLRGGSTGIKDIEGNAMVSNYSFSFTVAPIARRGSATTARTTINILSQFQSHRVLYKTIY